MTPFPAHQSAPASVIDELVRAGVSWETAMAMERWKAEEVLQLLSPSVGDHMPVEVGGSDVPGRGTL